MIHLLGEGRSCEINLVVKVYRFLHSEISKNRFLKQKIFFKIKNFGSQNQHWASLGQENTYISHDSTCGMDL